MGPLELDEQTGPAGRWVTLDQLCGVPMETGRFLRLAARIAAALAEIHGRFIVHRNIQPQSILVDSRTGAVTITGFQIAGRPRVVAPTPEPGVIEGSLAYMSPEQAGRINRPVDQRSDLYALGVTFYEMLTARLPFHASDPLGWVHCHVARAPQSPDLVAPRIPPVLSAIVMKLLAKVAEDRYQTARGLAFDLERCLSQWEAEGRIDPFPLGEWDLSDNLRVPSRIYGRRQELEILSEAFARVSAQGACELVLVGGAAGIGKTSLVEEFYGTVAAAQGFFVTQRFHHSGWDMPGSTFVQAFGDVIHQVLAEPEARLALWRRRIQDALGGNGRLMVSLLPHLELIVGPQPPVPELPLPEAEQRFRMVFSSLLQVLASREHPMVLFLDDVQWIDSASRNLVEEVLTRPDMGHLLVIGACRDNAGSAANAWVEMAADLRRAIPVHEIRLGPLGEGPLSHLVADALHCHPEEARPVARQVLAKTDGSPLFVIEFLRTRQQDGSIFFDRAAGRWRWDLARIEAAQATANVVELMAGVIGCLDAPTQEVLKLAACAGSEWDLRTLAAASGEPAEQVAALLRPLVGRGLLLESAGGMAPRGGMESGASTDGAGTAQPETETSYRWLHDRVRQAAYALLSPDDIPALHLALARALDREDSPDSPGGRLFDVTNHYNAGAALLSDPGEMKRVAWLNLLAGRRAIEAASHQSALRYLTLGQALLAAGGGDGRHELVYGLHFERARCEWACGHFEAAGSMLAVMMACARSRQELVDAYRLQIGLHTTQGEVEQAVQVAVEACRRLFGLDLPAHGTPEALRQLAGEVLAELGDRSMDELVRMAAMTDADARLEAALLSSSLPAAYYTDLNLYGAMTCQLARLGIRHGNSEYSPHGYATFAGTLGRLFRQWDQARAFTELAAALAGRPEFASSQASTYHTIGVFTRFWLDPPAAVMPWFRKAIESGLRHGDRNHACYAGEKLVLCRLVAGDRLEEVAGEAERQLAVTRDARYEVLHDAILSVQRFAQRMMGTTAGFSTFTGTDFSQESFELRLAGAPQPRRSLSYFTYKALAAFLAGDYEEAVTASHCARGFVAVAATQIMEAECCWATSLALAAHFDQAPPGRRKEYMATLVAGQEQLRLWREHNPATFADRFALVSAEIARLEGRESAAAGLYEEAIQAARAGGFVHNEGIACERAALFHLARGDSALSDAYFRNAYACYERWGARGKTRHMERRYPRLFAPADSRPAAVPEVRTDELDVLAVVKANQAISGEIVLDRLLDTLLRIAVEQAGAEKAYLLTARQEVWSVVAEARVEAHGIGVNQQVRLPSPEILPEAIVNYVRRTCEKVILDDAAASPFAGDTYISRTRPKSVLCMPIVRQTRPAGMLYLENNLTTGAFTPGRLAVLEILASQAAISLENATLYASLREEVLERQKAEQALRDSQRLLQAILDKSAALVVVKDRNRRYILANRRFQELLEKPEEAILGRTDEELFEPDLAGRMRAIDEAVLRDGKPREAENVVSLGDGARTFFAIRFPLFDDTGAPFAVCGISTDISERRLLEEQLRQSQKMEALGRLAGGVAHDFNNLLTVITGYCAMLLGRMETADPLREPIDEIRKAGERAAGLTRQLLTFSRRQVLQLRVLNINTVLDDLEKMLRRLIGEHIELVLVRGPDLGPVRADAGQLEQVIVNLAVNARDAMPSGGRLSIETSNVTFDEGRGRPPGGLTPGRYVCLVVRDTGVGMDAATLPHIFEPFFTTKGPDKGTGLGLSTVYGIVRQSHGEIEVTSMPGRGAEFRVYLPWAAEEPSAGRAGIVAQRRGTETILLVEDEDGVRGLLATVLKGRGYRVLEAAGGAEALRHAAGEHSIDLLLTDVVMPRMSGPELAARLATLYPGLRVLYMSGYAETGISDSNGVLKPGIAFLEKPFSPDMLGNKVREVLDSEPPPHS